MQCAVEFVQCHVFDGRQRRRGAGKRHVGQTHARYPGDFLDFADRQFDGWPAEGHHLELIRNQKGNCYREIDWDRAAVSRFQSCSPQYYYDDFRADD